MKRILYGRVVFDGFSNKINEFHRNKRKHWNFAGNKNLKHSSFSFIHRNIGLSIIDCRQKIKLEKIFFLHIETCNTNNILFCVPVQPTTLILILFLLVDSDQPRYLCWWKDVFQYSSDFEGGYQTLIWIFIKQ